MTSAADWLNIRSLSRELPGEFEGYYDAGKYRVSQEYLKENTRLSLFEDTVFTAVKLAFILPGGFNLVDLFARSLGGGPLLTGLVFAGTLMLALQLLALPFSAYHTFVIEGKYGFNRTSVPTFLLDLIKSWLIGGLIGGLIFAGVLRVFATLGPSAWFYGWLGVSAAYLFLVFVAPVVIMPLFNKFVPLEEGELRSAIEGYAASREFRMKGLFKMDASKRSTRSNAYFTGFGRFRRIVLFDTLIQRHTTDELVSVLAHEMGHYKKNHIAKSLLLSLADRALMFFILSFFINNPGLFEAFKVQQPSVYASLIFFAFLYAPVALIVSVLGKVFSRRYEYEADAYAVATYGKPEAMISALKKLSVDNLSNLTPHPLKVFLQYTHPPVLERVRALRKTAQAGA
ncbi:MAG: M48 family metallopeptidase [Endomicrobiales bacterium]